MVEYEDQRTKDAWDSRWRGISLPTKLRLWVPSIRAFDRFFRAALPNLRGKRVLEVGCCPGRWMVYFARQHGASVAGIDYAPQACDITRRNLQLHGLEAPCFHGDARDPAPDVGRYDLAFSMGVVEHYDDPREILRAHADLVVPGGTVAVTMPNYAGLHGMLLRRYNREAYQQHVPHTLADLQDAGRDVGRRPVHARAMGGLDPLLVSGRGGLLRAVLAAGVISASVLVPLDSERVSAHLGIVYRKK